MMNSILYNSLYNSLYNILLYIENKILYFNKNISIKIFMF